jgi:hypothetical protein
VPLSVKWALGERGARAFLVITSAVPVSGCASSTGILPAGSDTYTISERFAPIRGGGDEAERDALTKANDYCAQQGRKLVFRGRSYPPSIGGVSYGFTFGPP